MYRITLKESLFQIFLSYSHRDGILYAIGPFDHDLLYALILSKDVSCDLGDVKSGFPVITILILSPITPWGVPESDRQPYILANQRLELHFSTEANKSETF